ncbi:scavenger receptor cysteine-rich domain-containing group B protein-like [Diadema antillarum]|uniref:scavenger receptor cysteine-rich domain-containing group B protein-like n=1 Tax=Diadema antillarum TaxID=105358 RepID=UPI003A8BCB68
MIIAIVQALLVAQLFAPSASLGTLEPCPLPTEWQVDWQQAYDCLLPLNTQDSSWIVPGEVSPLLTVANIIDAAGASWTAETQLEGLAHICMKIAPRLPVLLGGPEVLQMICDPILTSVRTDAPFDGEAVCRLIWSMAMESAMPGSYSFSTSSPGYAYQTPGYAYQTPGYAYQTPESWDMPEIISYAHETSNPSPFNIPGLQDFDIMAEIQRIERELYGIDSYDVDSVCPAIDDILGQMRSEQDMVIQFATELTKVLIPVGAGLCSNLDSIASALMEAGLPASSIGGLLEEVPRLVAVAAGYDTSEELCDRLASATTPDLITSTAQRIVRYFFGLLTNEFRCTEIVGGALNVTRIMVPNLSQVGLIMSMNLAIGFSSPEEICRYIDTSFSLRGPPIPLRLEPSTSEGEGRVEVYTDGRWGTVCGDSFRSPEAKMVCSALGYRGESIALGVDHSDTIPVVIGDLTCIGVESNIAQCSRLTSPCGWGQDAAVQCNMAGSSTLSSTMDTYWALFETTPSTQGSMEVRLADGTSSQEGRVEVRFGNGEWGTVCDRGWGMEEADVVCRMLGFPGAKKYRCCGAFGEGPGDVLLSKVACIGYEANLGECAYLGNGVNTCQHTSDAGVICLPALPASLAVRLSGGSYPWEGRVEVNHGDGWGTVCDDDWDLNDAEVVCNMLGYPGARKWRCCAFYGPGDGTILLDDVRCTGDEPSLLDCQHRPLGEHNCSPSEDAGVVCNPPEADPATPIRLVGGNSPGSGRVEVYLNGEWGTICGNRWSISDGDVVCRSLGYDHASSVKAYAFYGSGTGPILLTDVSCLGDEDDIADCISNDTWLQDCDHSQDVGVRCGKLFSFKEEI